MYCPSCRSEYREGVTKCAPCDASLVPTLPELGPDKGDLLRKAVEENTAAAIARASYTDACRMVETLQQGGVDAMVSGDPATCGKGGQCSHFFVAVLPEDLKTAATVLRGEWNKLLDPELAAAVDREVDFDQEGAKECPACQAKFEGTPEECPDCGLFLGVG